MADTAAHTTENVWGSIQILSDHMGESKIYKSKVNEYTNLNLPLIRYLITPSFNGNLTNRFKRDPNYLIWFAFFHTLKQNEIVLPNFK